MFVQTMGKVLYSVHQDQEEKYLSERPPNWEDLSLFQKLAWVESSDYYLRKMFENAEFVALVIEFAELLTSGQKPQFSRGNIDYNPITKVK